MLLASLTKSIAAEPTTKRKRGPRQRNPRPLSQLLSEGIHANNEAGVTAAAFNSRMAGQAAPQPQVRAGKRFNRVPNMPESDF
jgi:hypothetical protein